MFSKIMEGFNKARERWIERQKASYCVVRLCEIIVSLVHMKEDLGESPDKSIWANFLLYTSLQILSLAQKKRLIKFSISHQDNFKLMRLLTMSKTQ